MEHKNEKEYFIPWFKRLEDKTPGGNSPR